MKKKIILVISVALRFFSADAMEPTDDNPMYLQYPKKYEKFKQKVQYGTVRSDFDHLPDVFNTIIRPYFAQAISTKFNHTLLNHNYQQKRSHKIRLDANQLKDYGFYITAQQTIAELPPIVEPQIENILNLTDLKRETDKTFQYHDGTYAKVPDLGCNYSLWDETLKQKKLVSITIPKKGEYKKILSGCNQKYGDFSMWCPEKEYIDNNKREFSIISKSLDDNIDTFSVPLKFTHSVMSKDGQWLALALENDNNNQLYLLNFETGRQESCPLENTIDCLVAGHQSPIFLACTQSSAVLSLSNRRKIVIFEYDSFDTSPSAAISPDDRKYIIYGGKTLRLYINNSTHIHEYLFQKGGITCDANIARGSFSPDSRLIILALENGSLLLFNTLSGKKIGGHAMNWAIGPSHNIPPLFLYSLKNQLLISLDPVAHHNSDVCTLVIRSLKTGRILSGYNFYPTSPCAMGLTQNERSLVFVNPDQTVTQLDLYNDQDIKDIHFIENKANIYQLILLFSLYKKHKPNVKKDTIFNTNATRLVMSMRDYIKKQYDQLI